MARHMAAWGTARALRRRGDLRSGTLSMLTPKAAPMVSIVRSRGARLGGRLATGTISPGADP